MPTITFSGLASGLDTNSWVEALVSVKQITVTSLQNTLETIEKKQSTVSELQASFNDLRTAIEKLTDSKFGGALDLFGNNSVTSSNEDIFTATVNQNAARLNYDIKVEQLATKTSVSSDKAVSAIANDDTKVSDLGVTEGKLTVYVDGVKQTINISSEDTVKDLKTRFAEAGVKAEIDSNGQLNLSAQNGTSEILIGATNDTSNIKSMLGLTQQEDGTYKSTSSLYQVTGTTKITTENIFSDGNGGTTSIKAGTFKIGDAEFTIDENTTINSLISDINNNKDAGATAYWDSANSKLVLTSTVEGQSYVNIEAGTSNFTDVMGFTESEWAADGSLTKSALKTDNQTLGENAILYINGTQVVSPTNTVTSELSRLDGVTINLKGVSTEEEPTTKLEVTQDTTKVAEALTTFVEKYNEVMTKLDELTAVGADLYGDTALNSIERSMRQMITSSTGYGDDIYTLLSQIGVSTAEAGASISADTTSLSIDEDKLKEALDKDPDAVKKLLVGTTSEEGLLTKFEGILDDALATDGWFSTTTSSIQSDMTRYNEKITKAQTSVDNYQARLQAQFQAMENTISKMQNSYSNLLNSAS